MLISAIDKEYTKEEATSANAYVVVDSETLGTGKIKLSELSNGEGSGGGSGYGSDWFIVNFSYDTNTNTYVSDKTHNEIKEWYDENGVMSFSRIKGMLSGRLLDAAIAPGDHQTPWTFEGSIIGVMNGVPAISYAQMTISYTNEVSLTAQNFTLATV